MRGTSPFRLGILGSGKGSNFVAIADAIDAGALPATIGVVLSDVSTSPMLSIARERNLQCACLLPGEFRTKLSDAATDSYIAALMDAKVDLVVLAGFMRILKVDLLRKFSGRVVNIHPSLLPSFPGLEAWKQALDYGVKVTGCTVHWVDSGIDTGPILAQRSVPVLDGDTASTLHERIQKAERELYPAVLAAIARGQITTRGRITSGFGGLPQT